LGGGTGPDERYDIIIPVPLTRRTNRRDPVHKRHVHRHRVVRRIGGRLGVLGEHGGVNEEEVGERELLTRQNESSGRRGKVKLNDGYTILTSAPETYVPTWRTFGPTSRRGSERWKKPRGSYCDCGLDNVQRVRVQMSSTGSVAYRHPTPVAQCTHSRNRHSGLVDGCDREQSDNGSVVLDGEHDMDHDVRALSDPAASADSCPATRNQNGKGIYFLSPHCRTG